MSVPLHSTVFLDGRTIDRGVGYMLQQSISHRSNLIYNAYQVRLYSSDHLPNIMMSTHLYVMKYCTLLFRLIKARNLYILRSSPAILFMPQRLREAQTQHLQRVLNFISVYIASEEMRYIARCINTCTAHINLVKFYRNIFCS